MAMKWMGNVWQYLLNPRQRARHQRRSIPDPREAFALKFLIRWIESESGLQPALRAKSFAAKVRSIHRRHLWQDKEMRGAPNLFPKLSRRTRRILASE